MPPDDSTPPYTLRICIAIALTTLSFYAPAVTHDFISFDDPTYVSENIHVRYGLSWQSFKWTLTSVVVSNWHPVTMLSHILDAQLYGLFAGGHHATAVLLHTLNAVLLFLLLQRMTRARWCAALVAGLFALHPLHVESVAWVSERKDVLSTSFWLLCSLAYLRYTKDRRIRTYVLSLFLLAMGLMCKPMLVTLPFTLLLFDLWPLGRISLSDDNSQSVTKQAGRLIIEKIPMFLIVVVSSVTTFLVQRSQGAVADAVSLPMGERGANVLSSYATYILKMVWPTNMTLFYPYSAEALSYGLAALGAILLLCGTVFALRTLKTKPYFAVGWFWYLGTLVPVVGLVQVGSQAMADRYTYIPLIGLFIIIAWGLKDFTIRFPRTRRWVAEASALWLVILSALTVNQLGYWKNDLTLFSHALAVTEDNFIAESMYGNALHDSGQTPQAIEHLQKALSIRPDLFDVYVSLGNIFYQERRIGDSIDSFEHALAVNPNHAPAHVGLGISLLAVRKAENAKEHFREALRLEPENAEAHNNLGAMLAAEGNIGEAMKHFSEALRLKPDYENARSNLKRARSMGGNAEGP